MQFYLTALDETKKFVDENPSIGIVICKSKNRTIVEYALKGAEKPIGVATYGMYHELPYEMKDLLPEPQAIAKRLSDLEDVVSDSDKSSSKKYEDLLKNVGMVKESADDIYRVNLPVNWWA